MRPRDRQPALSESGAPDPDAPAQASASGMPAVILASAGSGKTFELAGRYVSALVNAGGSPDRILATTFTRKAAGEMLAKILARLLEASRGEAEVAGLKAERAREVALALARRIDRLRVQTLDSYFAEIGRIGAGELGLSPGWRILDETENEEAQEDAIDAVCRTLDPGQLVAILESLNFGALPMKPRTELIRRAQTLHAAFIDCGGDSRKWGTIQPNAADQLSEEEVHGLLVSLDALPPVLKQDRTERKDYKEARRTIADCVATQNWPTLNSQKIVQAALTGNQFSKTDIPALMADILKRLAAHAQVKAVEDLARASRAAGGLMTVFDAKLRETKEARNALTFDDLPRLMLALDEEERRWISFRMDGRVDHLLLDEFQDTSRVQYRVLEPVLEEIASTRKAGRSLFAVGDIKQSLYGWRGAVPELLEGLTMRLGLGDPETRSESWRSSQGVLEAVNTVFGTIDTNKRLERFLPAAARWRSTFRPHRAARDVDGFVRLEQVRLAKKGEERRIELVMDRAVERVVEISAEHPDWSVAVITRTNAVIPRVIYRLRKHGIFAAQERGHPLMDEPCVGAVISLLQLAEHPGDTASRYHVAKTALAGPLEMPSAMDDRVAERVSREVRERAAQTGIAGVVAWVRKGLEGTISERGSNRLEHMERLARGVDSDPQARIPEFIRLVHDSAVVDESAGRVSVLNVHKAKGLEWDAVVLIDLDGPWDGKTASVVVDRGEAGESDPLAPVEAVSLWPSKEQQACDPRLASLAERWMFRGVRESISCLYVAMTRAKRRLDMIIGNKAEPSKRVGAAEVLREALAGDRPESDETGEASELYSRKYEAKVTASSSKARPVSATTQFAELQFAPAKIRAGVGLAPSKQGHGAAKFAVDLLREPGAHAASRTLGEIWHAWFERVEWQEDWNAPDEELLRDAARFRLDTRDLHEQVARFREAIAGQVGRALSRVRYAAQPGELRVLREWALAWNEGGRSESDAGGLVQGRIDRVVVGMEAGRAIWAEVLDFKTDKVTPERVEVLGEVYRTQIHAYRSAVGRALKLDPARVNGVLLFVRPGIAFDVR